jgi:predicted 3-demethylubiquinone-9 3-methyltransferase (glyoxalase superfamily)
MYSHDGTDPAAGGGLSRTPLATRIGHFGRTRSLGSERSTPVIMSQKITPFLWFDGRAEEAARFYTSVFKKSKIVRVTPMYSAFRLEDQEFIALNGGPKFTFTPAISFFVRCKTQKEVDFFGEKLSHGGETLQCGWLRDRFGVSWQVVPSVLSELLEDADSEGAERVWDAMLKMTKFDISKLKKAYAGK